MRDQKSENVNTKTNLHGSKSFFPSSDKSATSSL